MNSSKVSTRTKGLLVVFLMFAIGCEALTAGEAKIGPERMRVRIGRIARSLRLFCASTTTAGHDDRPGFLFEIGGVETGKPFLSLIGTPENFRSIDDVCSRVITGLTSLPMCSGRIDCVVKYLRRLLPNFMDQVSDSTALVGVRILLNGPWDADQAWIGAGFESEQHNDSEASNESYSSTKEEKLLPSDIFKTVDLNSNDPNPVSLKVCDHCNFELLPDALQMFEPGDELRAYYGSCQIRTADSPWLNCSVGAILSSHAKANNSEAYRMVFGNGEPDRCNPVVVLSAYHLSSDEDPAEQMINGEAYVNSVAYEIDMERSHLWSIQTANLPLTAHVELCGVGTTIIASMTGISDQPARQMLDQWLEQHGGETSIFDPIVYKKGDRVAGNAWETNKATKYISRYQLVQTVAEDRKFDGLIVDKMKAHGLIENSQVALEDALDEFISDLSEEILKSHKPVIEYAWTSWLEKVIDTFAAHRAQLQELEDNRNIGRIPVDKKREPERRDDSESILREKTLELQRKAYQLMIDKYPDLVKYMATMDDDREDVAKALGCGVGDIKYARERVRKKAKKLMDDLKGQMEG